MNRFIELSQGSCRVVGAGRQGTTHRRVRPTAALRGTNGRAEGASPATTTRGLSHTQTVPRQHMPKTTAVAVTGTANMCPLDHFMDEELRHCQLFIEYNLIDFGSIHTSNLHGASTQQKSRLPTERSGDALCDGGLTLLMLNYSGL